MINDCTVDFISLGTRVDFAWERRPSVLYPIATQIHGNGSCFGEVSIPWVCMDKDKWTLGPRCHADNIHAVRSEVKSTVPWSTTFTLAESAMWDPAEMASATNPPT